MKIFTLESKKQVLGKSILLGWLVGILVNFVTVSSHCSGSICVTGDFGFPFRHAFDAEMHKIFLGPNTLFWIVVSFLILSLLRHFSKKPVVVPSN